MRALLVFNPTATRVRERSVSAVVRVLSRTLDVEVAGTKGRGHAAYLSAGAAHEGRAAVIAYGGDGTVNEVLQGLAGTNTPLGLIPGGSTNVFARALGLPLGPPRAAEAAALAVRRRTSRVVNLGRADPAEGMPGRWFAFCAGFGFDAAVARRISSGWRLRPAILLQAAYATAGLATLLRGYDRRGTDITVEVPGIEPLWSMRTALCSNSDPYTYLRSWPARVCPEAYLEAGLDVTALAEMSQTQVLRTVWTALRSDAILHLPWVRSFHDAAEIRLRSRSPLPWQVDGDYAGETDFLTLTSVPGAIQIAC